MHYHNKEWLYYEYHEQRRTTDEIAEQFGINRKTVSYFLKKYDIPKPCKESELLIEITCHNCKEPTSKPLTYLRKRIKVGRTKVFCSRECADLHHSKTMTGENNPNFNGVFHGESTSEWSDEKRAKAIEKMKQTVKEKGLNIGEKNPRWKGGRKDLDCVICGKSSTYSPYTYRKIQEGKQKPCCNNECALALSRRSVKFSSTSIEVKMANELSVRGIEYIEQYILGDKFRLDFLLPEYNIVIECDGNYWHTLPKTVKRDKAKNAYIKACGFSLYRFWESEINSDVESCVDVVMAEINEKEAN
ncbi:DUF559 domain-containing protein [Neobacillus mesonae]|nr:DUF559 domain-containing protein [Neobacillus mesonae]